VADTLRLHTIICRTDVSYGLCVPNMYRRGRTLSCVARSASVGRFVTMAMAVLGGKWHDQARDALPEPRSCIVQESLTRSLRYLVLIGAIDYLKSDKYIGLLEEFVGKAESGYKQLLPFERPQKSRAIYWHAPL